MQLVMLIRSQLLAHSKVLAFCFIKYSSRPYGSRIIEKEVLSVQNIKGNQNQNP